MEVRRRISAAFKDMPGGQVLGPTFDYTHRLLDFSLLEQGEADQEASPAGDGHDAHGGPMPGVAAFLSRDGVMEDTAPDDPDAEVGDLTRDPLTFPADRDLRLQNLARGDEGFVMSLGYSVQRGFGNGHPFVAEIRMGETGVEIVPEELGFAVDIGDITVTECQMVSKFDGSHQRPAQFTRGYGLTFGYCERKAMAMSLVDRSLRLEEFGEEPKGPAQDQEFVLSHSDNVEASGFVQHLKLPHHVDFQAELDMVRALRRRGPAPGGGVMLQHAQTAAENDREQGQARGYNFAYLDEQTKKMIRRAILKAVAVPGYQAPFAGREMPMPYGWGTGGIQVTASIIGRDDVLKVIDQGADDTTNAVSIRRFFRRTTGVATTEHTAHATIIQTRHRIPETPLAPGRILVYQVPIPETLRWMEPRETETRKMHAHEEYGIMHVKLYEDIARHGRIATSFDYPVAVAGRYVMSPSPIPKFDNPKMHRSPALQLFGAGREKRIYAIPPHTEVRSLDFEDHPFEVQRWDQCCGLCGAGDSYLDEIILDDAGNRMFVCSDSDYCRCRREAGRRGPMGAAMEENR